MNIAIYHIVTSLADVNLNELYLYSYKNNTMINKSFKFIV